MTIVTDFEDDKFPLRLLKYESMSAKCHSQYYFYLNLDNQTLLLDSISSVNLCLEFQIHHFVFSYIVAVCGSHCFLIFQSESEII